MTKPELIKTKIFRSNKDFISKREKRIAEAIAFEGGTILKPKKHLICALPNGKESYFLKPGKETQRAIPNVHDMTPNVGCKDKSDTNGYTFEKIWEYLIKISIINQITFKKVLVLLYRNCFLLDHLEVEEGKFRYLPSKGLSEYIAHIEFGLRDGFMDEFKTKEIGLLEYLHFIDLLGWNEDIKYHVKNSKPDFKTVNNKTGRVNTILSVIKDPLIINSFFLGIPLFYKVNMEWLLSTFIKPRKYRNLWEISNRQLLEQLTPHLIEG